MPSVLAIVQVLLFALGLFFIYVAAFTYETTDKRIQNTLEDLWLRLSDVSHSPAGLATRLARVVLTLMDRIFERVFGARRVSIRSVSAAACYTYGVQIVSILPMWSFLGLLAGEDLTRGIARGPAVIGLAYLAVGTLPAVHASLSWITYAAAFLAIPSDVLLQVWALMTATRPRPIPAIAFVLTFPYGIAVIHAIRDFVQKSVKGEANARVPVLFGSLLAIALVAFAALSTVATLARFKESALTLWVYSFMRRHNGFELLTHLGRVFSPWGFALFIGLALSLVVLLHVMMWPATRFFLMKTLYAAQRHQLIRRKATLWSVGLGLLVCAIVPPGELLTRLMEAAR
jgi:hypothetical protein